MTTYRVCVDYIVEAQNETEAASRLEPLLDPSGGALDSSVNDAFIVEVYEDDREEFNAEFEKAERRASEGWTQTWRDRQGV